MRFGDGDDTDGEEHSASPDAANNLDNGEDEEQADEEIKNNEDTKESHETDQVPICFKKFPKNFKVLFAFPHKRCNCHNWRMTARQIFRHEGLNFDEWFRNLLDVERHFLHGRRKKSRTAVFRRHQERLIQRLVDKVQKLTLVPSRSN